MVIVAGSSVLQFNEFLRSFSLCLICYMETAGFTRVPGLEKNTN